MKLEARFLLGKACDSLMLAIELFSRPHDRGWISSMIIMLDHSFKMLMKAAILHREGWIREKCAMETIGFDACVRRSLSAGRIKYLAEEQAIVLQTINGLRDATQHYLLIISEGPRYIHIQSGVTLFRDLLKDIFEQDLTNYIPTRMLPVSTSPPKDLTTLFESEVIEIKKLLILGRRRQVEAMARLRPLSILDATSKVEKGQPGDTELRPIGKKISMSSTWTDLFPGVASIEIESDGIGLTPSLRLTKQEGIPSQLVPKGTPGASVVAVKRVNELDFYSLGAKQLAEKTGLMMPKLLAVVEYLGLCFNEDYYKEFRIGSETHKRYSPKAIEKSKEALKKESADEIWRNYMDKKHRKVKS
jgi:hypothetical protein